MSSFIIEGGRKLSGEIIPQGAKNEALQILCAVLLSPEKITINNLPDIVDINILIDLLSDLGVKIQKLNPNSYTFKSDEINLDYLTSDEFKTKGTRIRGSIMIVGPLLARFGKGYIPKPGGDKIGRRRLDTHFIGFERLGAKFDYDSKESFYRVTTDGLKGTYMLMDEGLDTGSVLNNFEIPINYKYNAKFLHDELSHKAASELINTMDEYVNGSIVETPQENIGITYASKILKDESRLDWSKTSQEIFFSIKALNPFPGTWFESKENKRIKILDAEVNSLCGNPGEVLDSLIIGCGENSLTILDVQPEGGKEMSVDDFLRGNPINIGCIMN